MKVTLKGSGAITVLIDDLAWDVTIFVTYFATVSAYVERGSSVQKAPLHELYAAIAIRNSQKFLLTD